MKCTFHVENNQYNKCWLKTTTNQYIFLEPKIYRFFEGDEVEFDEKTKQLNLIRCNMPKLFPGTILFTDKIYGKHSNNKYYFKFIPYDKNYPALLVHCKPDIVFNKKKEINMLLLNILIGQTLVNIHMEIFDKDWDT